MYSTHYPGPHAFVATIRLTICSVDFRAESYVNFHTCSGHCTVVCTSTHARTHTHTHTHTQMFDVPHWLSIQVDSMEGRSCRCSRASPARKGRGTSPESDQYSTRLQSTTSATISSKSKQSIAMSTLRHPSLVHVNGRRINSIKLFPQTWRNAKSVDKQAVIVPVTP